MAIHKEFDVDGYYVSITLTSDPDEAILLINNVTVYIQYFHGIRAWHAPNLLSGFYVNLEELAQAIISRRAELRNIPCAFDDSHTPADWSCFS